METDPVNYTYELDSWPDYDFEGIKQYPDRMQDILREARDNNVIVMITLFDACLKNDGRYWPYSAWNPQRNNYVTDAYLPRTGSPYPQDQEIDEETDKCFYNIWEWQEDMFGTYIEFKDKRLNALGGIQRDYVKRVVHSIPDDCWNVIFEIENEPKKVIAQTNRQPYNLSARWSYQIAKWIKEERPKALVAFNAQGEPYARRGLFLLDQGADRMIDIVSIHASNTAGDYDNWQLDDPDGPPYNGDYTAWENAEKDYILDALNRTREDTWYQQQGLENVSSFFIIDSDGDTDNHYDQNADRVERIAGIASLFGAGYNNKYSSIINYDAPVFNQDNLVEFNNCINERFFDEEQDWKYGMYYTYPDDYRRSYFENNAIRCMERYPIIKDMGVSYSIDFKVINNGTWEDLQEPVYYLYDKTKDVRVQIQNTLDKVSPAWNWTIPISDLPDLHKETVTMTFPESLCSYVVHELYLEKKISENEYERIGGDVLYVVVNLVEE